MLRASLLLAFCHAAAAARGRTAVLSSRGGAVTLESDDTAVLFSLRGGAVKLKTDEDKYCYALGCNVGRQIGDLDCLSPEELDVVLLAVKDVLTKQEARVNLMELMPKAADYSRRSMTHTLRRLRLRARRRWWRPPPRRARRPLRRAW